MSSSFSSPQPQAPHPLDSYSSCEISDTLIKLGVPNGGHIPDIVSALPTSALDFSARGPAYTVKMVLASDTMAPRLDKHFVDTVPEGSVIFIDAPREAKNAVWGGLMTAGAKARGALGVIISGRCRDTQEHVAAAFPVFSRGWSTVGQSPFTRPSAVQIPLAIQAEGNGSLDSDFPAVNVHPGDYLVADIDGVVCVPQDLVEEVAKVAELGREVDKRCMEDIQAGLGVQAAFKKHRGK